MFITRAVLCRLLKLDVNSAKQVIVGDSATPQSLPFFSTELSPEAQEVGGSAV